jgi:4-hydroxymandelate oxidase
MDPINLFEFELRARDTLPRMAYDYFASGSHDEITLTENHIAYDRIALRYRVLRDVSSRDLSARVLGHEIDLPVLLSPTAFHRLAHPDGERGSAQAAGAAGTIMMLSTLSNTAVEEVTAAASGPVWFQLYVYKDREVTADLVRRAESAGCGAIVLTVDAPVLGTRERDVRNRFALPTGLRVENLTATGGDITGADRIVAPSGGSGLAAYVTSLLDPAISWKDLEWLSGLTSLPVLVKGIVHAADARLAVEHGAAGVIVSNHGGRQLDTSIATIDALPAIAEAVAAQRAAGFALLIDGGVRRGTDVVKAIALGADAVCVGRPAIWGLAVDGESGVRRVLRVLRDELDEAMALCGCRSVDDIRALGGDLIARD